MLAPPTEVLLRSCCAVLLLHGHQNRGRGPLNAAPRLDLGPLVIVLQVHSAWSRLDAQSTDRPSRCMVVVVCNGVLGGVVIHLIVICATEKDSPAAVFSGISAINRYRSAAFAAKETPF